MQETMFCFMFPLMMSTLALREPTKTKHGHLLVPAQKLMKNAKPRTSFDDVYTCSSWRDLRKQTRALACARAKINEER